MLEITVYDEINGESTVYEDYDYVSLVSGETYGPPPLVAPTKDGKPPTAKVGERVLVINTHFVPMWEIVRTKDR